MSKNYIDVSVSTGKPTRVNVSTPANQQNVDVTRDTSAYNAEISKQWATSETLVLNEDYSSKYYANKSKNYAQNAESFEAAVRETYDNFINLSNETTEEITGLKQTSITEIEDIKSSSVADINANVNTGIENINNTVANGLTEINSTKTTILNDIEFVADGEKEEIKDLVDAGKDEIQELTNEIKDNAEDIINRVSLSMFDTILKDHVLSYEESRGLALQGTYVYKNAVAGERYGYADFYAKCLEEYRNATIEKFDKYLLSNISIVGSLIDNQGVLSGFSSANYAKVSSIYSGTANNVEFTTKIKVSDFHGTYNDILKPHSTNCPIGFNSAGKLGMYNTSSWLVGSTVYPTNTSIWVKVVWNGASYKIYGLLDKSYTVDTLPSIGSWTLEATWTTTTNIWSQQLYLGNSNSTTGEYVGGTIDLNESYININGERWWTGTQRLEFDYLKNSNGHLFYDIANKVSIDNFFNDMGSAWFYGIDTENERVFLPRNNFFEQATGDISEVGQSVEAGLPNIEGTLDTTGSLGSGQRASTSAGTGCLSPRAKADAFNYGKDGIASQTTGISLDASRSNAIYGNSDTVQPNAVKKLLYICVGNTVSDTSWVDVVTQVEGGVKDLEDKTNEGIEALSNASNALRQTQITNCLLEVPQNIKLELKDGVLTLKAGSKVIVPNGVGKFEEIVIPNDVSFNGSPTGTQFIAYNATKGTLTSWGQGITSSGGTMPTTQYFYWFDTTNNYTKISANYGDSVGIASLPLARCSANGTQITSIDQVFNGFGYIGSTIWVDKGVKGLVPNGRNEDGSLNNIEYTFNKLATITANSTANFKMYIDKLGKTFFTTQVSYDEDKNLNIITSSGVDRYCCEVGSLTMKAGVISDFQPKLPFRAVDQNEFNKSINTLSKAYITETYSNGTSWYRIWSDKWCEQGGYSNTGSGVATINFLKAFANTNYIILKTMNTTSTNNVQYCNVSFYSRTTTSAQTKTADVGYSWFAAGYIA